MLTMGRARPLSLLAFLLVLPDFHTGRGSWIQAPLPTPKHTLSQPLAEQPPKGPSAGPFVGLWFANHDRTMWAGWDAVHLHTGGNQVLGGRELVRFPSPDDVGTR
jgi:hypothetical protein